MNGNGTRKDGESYEKYLERLLKLKRYNPEKPGLPINGLEIVNAKNLIFLCDQEIEIKKLKYLNKIGFDLEKSKNFPVRVFRFSCGTEGVDDGHHRAATMQQKLNSGICAEVIGINHPYETRQEFIKDRLDYW